MKRNVEIGDVFKVGSENAIQFIVTDIETRFNSKIFRIQYLTSNKHVKKGEVLEILERDLYENDTQFVIQKEITDKLKQQLEYDRTLLELEQAEKEWKKSVDNYNRVQRKLENLIVELGE